MSGRGGDTRARIEQAALGLFVEKGVAATSVRDIAAAVGLSDGALYRHYPSKDELVRRLFAAGFGQFAQTLERLAEDRTQAREKIAAMVGGFCALFDQDSVLFRFLLLVQHDQLQHVRPGMANPVESVRRVVAAGMADGEIPQGDPDLATAMVMGIILQTATFRVYGRITRPLGQLVPVLSAACWKALRVDQKG
jgi:AcrR family transcriptional regulator